MGSGFSKMKKQARAMQEQVREMQESLRNKVVQGRVANYLVVVTMNGEKELLKITIHPECVSDIDGLQDLILAACQNAYSQLQEEKPEGMNFPFSI